MVLGIGDVEPTELGTQASYRQGVFSTQTVLSTAGIRWHTCLWDWQGQRSFTKPFFNTNSTAQTVYWTKMDLWLLSMVNKKRLKGFTAASDQRLYLFLARVDSPSVVTVKHASESSSQYSLKRG